MGVVNVTPDSFSDGGQWYGADAAIAHGLVRAGLTVSIDTMRARVADFALEAGAQLVNDVSGGLADADMPRLVAAAGVGDAVVHAGVDPGRIVLDPGLGFGKRPEHNWPLLARLAELGTLAGGSFPVLVGASRKGFLGRLLAGHDG